MLPKPQRESFGSPEPYHYYPSHVFVLPFSLKHQVALNNEQKSQASTDYIVESFHSKSSKLLIFRLSLNHTLKENLLNQVLHQRGPYFFLLFVALNTPGDHVSLIDSWLT